MSTPVALVRGQNVPWPDAGVVVEVVPGAAAGGPPGPAVDCDVSALLVDERQRVASSADLVFYNQPAAPGAELVAGTPARLRLDLPAVPPRVHAVLCLISVDPHVPPLGSLPPLEVVLRGADGAERARFPLVGLTTERALVAVEVYRRGAGWRVRAVGQGYDGGLAQALTLHGVEVDEPATAGSAPAPSSPGGGTPAPAGGYGGPPRPPAGQAGPPPPGTSDAERLFRQAAAIVEDAARSTAALRSSVAYADRRRDEALAQVLADPRLRTGPAHAQATAGAERAHAALVGEAAGRHRRDLEQLRDELAQYEARLPPALAPWSSPAWGTWQPPLLHTGAVRVGDLHVEEAPWLRLPLLLGLPLSRPLWVDTTTEPGGATPRMVRSLVTRLLAAYPAGGLDVVVVDLVGGLGEALAPLAQPGSRAMRTATATSVAAAGEVLDALVRRVDLVGMARSAGALDALGDDGADRLLVLHDFPTALDDAAVGRVRYLVDEGRDAGVQVLLTGEQSPVLAGSPLVTTLLRESMRLPLHPDDHLADGWTGSTWTFTPDLGPDDARVLDGVLRSAAGTAWA